MAVLSVLEDIRPDERRWRFHPQLMDVAETVHFLVLDDDWRLLRRLEAKDGWCSVVAQLLQCDSQWIVIDQQRLDASSPMPSRDDIRLSRAISRRLRPMEVKLADHVIRSWQSRFSFREAGLL